MDKQKNNQKRKRYKQIILFEILVLVLLGLVRLLYLFLNRSLNKININNQDDKLILQPEEVNTKGYRNIVIFGLDTRDNSLKYGNSDTIMIVSIENKSKNIKLLSIYRDSYVEIPDLGYKKINAAYANGGYSLALSSINQNFDLNINEYVTLNFQVVVDIVDRIAGITLDIQEEEVKILNGYVRELNRINDSSSPGLEKAGTQLVNGTQATAYARIRYTTGYDYKRTERQRIVLTKVFEKVKNSSFTVIYDLIQAVLPQISTNLRKSEILLLAKDILNYNIVDQNGFPYEKESLNFNRDSYVLPINLEENVINMHKNLFQNHSYLPSKKVVEISNYLEDIRSKY